MAIYIHDEVARLRLRVAGDLDDSAARELACSWQTASSVVSGRKIVLDLRSLSSANERGRQLLESLHHLGVEFLARTPFQAGLVAAVTGGNASSKLPKEASLEEERAGASGNWLKSLLGPAGV